MQKAGFLTMRVDSYLKAHIACSYLTVSLAVYCVNQRYLNKFVNSLSFVHLYIIMCLLIVMSFRYRLKICSIFLNFDQCRDCWYPLETRK